MNSVQELLNSLNLHGLNGLKVDFGIKSSSWDLDQNLVVLNYDQIESSKYKDHPVVKLCRSLVVRFISAEQGWKIESRSFDRFFNYGETECSSIDITDCEVYEKVDGSLVSVWYSKEHKKWLYRTKSMIMPAEDMKLATGRTWKDLIESMIIGPFKDQECTYIFEVCSRDNRVVTKYDDQAVLLAIRDNESGEYIVQDEVNRQAKEMAKVSPKIRVPVSYSFHNMEDCLNAAKELPELKEGYVAYHNGTPVMKVKSPAYVAAHRLRGEGVITPKRIIEMEQIGEGDEYLAIFPEDRELYMETANALYNMIDDMYTWWYDKYQYITDQKEFAVGVMAEIPLYQGFMFRKKKATDQDKDINFDDMVKATNSKRLVDMIDQFKSN